MCKKHLINCLVSVREEFCITDWLDNTQKMTERLRLELNVLDIMISMKFAHQKYKLQEYFSLYLVKIFR